MNERNKPVWACRCGAVITKVQSRTYVIHLDAEPEIILESKGGPDVGYTLGGRRIEGYYHKHGEPLPKGMAAWEVHRIHKCPGAKAAAGQ